MYDYSLASSSNGQEQIVTNNETPELKSIYDNKVNDTSKKPYSGIAIIEITYSDGTKRHLTGSLVSSDTNLTTAHGIYSAKGKGWAKKITVHLGKNGEKTIEDIPASNWMIHPQYLSTINDDKYKFDLGAIKLATPINNSEYIFPISNSTPEN